MDKIDCQVDSNWSSSGDKCLNDCAKWDLQSEKSDKAEIDIYDVISVETCIQLDRPKGHQTESPCTLTLSSKTPNLYIGKITILSEARNIELFGQLNEYITTGKGEFVDNVDDDFMVYKTILSLPIPTQSCNLKLLGLRDKDSTWIYGIYLHLQPHTPSPNYWKLDVSKISDRLMTSKTDITDKATRMINMISSFQQAPNSSPIFELLKQVTGPPHRPPSGTDGLNSQAVMSMFKQNQQASCSTQEASPKMAQGDALKLAPSVLDHGSHGNDLLTNLFGRMQLVVKQEVAEMENRLENKIKEELSEISRKQDEILHLLRNKRED